jgi:hypothetical protein
MKVIAMVLAAVVSASCWAGDESIVLDSTASEIEEGAHRFGATTDGAMTWWIVRRADVANTPDWSAGGDPPLSLSKALQLATAKVSTYTTTPGAFRLDKVELLTFGANCCMDPVRKWIYVVTFEREYMYGGQRFDARGTLTIPVLLDGRVIEGVKE